MGAVGERRDVRRLIAVMVAMGELVKTEDPDGTTWYIATPAFDRLMHAEALAASGIEIRAATDDEPRADSCPVSPPEAPPCTGSYPRRRRATWRARVLSALLGLLLVPAVGVTAWAQQREAPYVQAPRYHEQRAPTDMTIMASR